MQQVRSNAWSDAEVATLARSVVRAPSVHNIQPWRLEVGQESIRLWERPEPRLPRQDPQGRDRVISCGAALANLELAVRALGRTAEVTFLPDPSRRELVASIRPGIRHAPDAGILRRYSAIVRRRSHRSRFTGPAAPSRLISPIVTAASPAARVQLVLGDAERAAVANLLKNAADLCRLDQGYRRELALWTIRDADSHRHGVGIAASCLSGGSLPWVDANSTPGRGELVRRLEEETLMVFLTDDDSRADHLRAGYGMQNAWLTAVAEGLAASIVTQPLQHPEVRAALSAELDLSGHPQLLMRIGYPGVVLPRPSLRRSIHEVLQSGARR